MRTECHFKIADPACEIQMRFGVPSHPCQGNRILLHLGEHGGQVVVVPAEPLAREVRRIMKSRRRPRRRGRCPGRREQQKLPVGDRIVGIDAVAENPARV